MAIRRNTQNTDDTTYNLKLKMKEDQSVVASFLLRRGHKIIMGGIKCTGVGRKREG